jgi:glyoxylase-like metal-dependent hydrolase (beta-lactamase superfamily II)
MLNLCVGIKPLARTQVVRGLLTSLLLASLIPLTGCQSQYDYVVLRQVAGVNQTNAYLLYDVPSGAAALFDVAGPIDSLLAEIDQKGLQVEYVFTTHAHPDHVQGLPDLRDRYPHALWGVSHEEYEDLSLYARWEEELPPEEAAGMKAAAEQDPAFAEMLAFDFTGLGQPDLFLEDGQVHRLGDLQILTFLTPGHSRGSICYHAGNALFSGDVLFKGRVGSTDFPKSGGLEAITSSVRRLYEILPEETVVYPGHGDFTDIGTEKRQNTGVGGDPGESP